MRERDWTGGRLLVVLDIGKSNAKLVLLDPVTGTEISAATRPNAPLAGKPRQLDIAGLQDWMLRTLAALPERPRIGAIVPVAHGASCVLLDRNGLPLLAPDYEDEILHAESARYDALRDPFARTLSPGLPTGLNVGRQLHFVQTRMPALFVQVETILLYPQYWAYVLSGVAATELTSLGCHTDLWMPAQHRYSELTANQGWTRLFPPLRRADEILGTLRPEIAQQCDLPMDCVVLCGIHDSNASYLKHWADRPHGEPFCVVSSGTWTVLLANSTPLNALCAEQDMLGNVDAYGGIVGTARFMGGREYRAVAGADAPPPSVQGMLNVLQSDANVLPSFAAGGPFLGLRGSILNADALDPVERACLASFYVALLSDFALDLLHADGDVIVDGPLAGNAIFCSLLAALRPDSSVRRGDGGAGSIGGARCLLLGRDPDPHALLCAVPFPDADALRRRRTLWREQVVQHAARQTDKNNEADFRENTTS